jgi:hypothetical protein
MQPAPTDPDLELLKSALVRAASVNGPEELVRLRSVTNHLLSGNVDGALVAAENSWVATHYRFWGRGGRHRGFQLVRDSLARVAQNSTILADMEEVLSWATEESRISPVRPALPFACLLELHARYSSLDISTALGLTNLAQTGQTGVGVLHAPGLKAYAMLITFQKTEREFSPSTMYADYPISRELFHWESQSNTSQASPTGQNLIHHQERGYTILLFARDVKQRNATTMPFTYLGPADLEHHESERPIKVVWRLRHPMPAEMFETNRRGG